MKKYIIILSLIIAWTSCSDFIEHDERGTQNVDIYFETEEECENWINDLYRRAALHYDWWQLIAARITNEAATDDAWMGNTGQSQEDHFPGAHYVITPSRMGRINTVYTKRYESILECNQAIHGIPKSENISQDSKDRYIAEALFLRAFNYYELVNNFGGVPLVLDVLSTSQLNKEKASKEDVYTAIEDDLIEAIRLFKTPPTISELNSKRGKANIWTCKALMARVSLFQGKNQQAHDYADDIIVNGPYALESKFIDIWNVNNHQSKEVIFETETSDNSNYNLGNQMPTYSGARGEVQDAFPSQDKGDVWDGWGWGVPTSDLENCYLSENDTERLKCTIIKWGESVYGDEVNNPIYKFDLGQNKSGRIIRKYYIPIETRRTLVKKRENAPLNLPIIRLAEIYLTRAEALYHLNQGVKAMDDVDFVRARVNLSPKKGTVSGTNILKAIWKERRMELAFEGLRLYDIRRQIDPDTNQPMIASLLGSNGSFVKYNTLTSTDPYETTNKGELQDKGANFDLSKHLVWPIPQAEVDRSGGLVKQNPNY